MSKLACAKAELLETAIAGWKDIELEKIRQNPSAYVVSLVSLVPPQQERQVTSDENGSLSEFSQESIGSMTASSRSIVEEASAVNPNTSPEEIVQTAKEATESTISEPSASVESESIDAEINSNQEQS